MTESTTADERPAAGKSSWGRILGRVILFPWGIHWLCARPAAWLRKSQLHESSSLIRLLCLPLTTVLWICFGLPITLILLLEGMISLNELVIAEQADYRLQSDFEAGKASDNIELPGERLEATPLPPIPPGTDRRETFEKLVAHFSPVVVQKVSNQPQWDIPLLIDFDGTHDPDDNVVNEPKGRPHPAGLYGEVTAETADSFYLTYTLYHVKDYDHPIREMLTRWSYHDSDNEGYHIRVDKASMSIVSIETWFHNRFLLFNRSGKSLGTEPVHGTIHTEGGSHPIMYVQPQGHGVRCAQVVDGDDLRKSAKILRHRPDAAEIRVAANGRFEPNGTYTLDSFEAWYQAGKADLIDAEGQLFSGRIPLGTLPDGTPIVAGRFIQSVDYYVGGWSRPKPMWSWDDGWDELPIFVWHALPSYSFESHEGTSLSHEYVFSRPVEEMLGLSVDVFVKHFSAENQRRRGPKWQSLHNRGKDGVSRRDYFVALEQAYHQYINYLFHALG